MGKLRSNFDLVLLGWGAGVFTPLAYKLAIDEYCGVKRAAFLTSSGEARTAVGGNADNVLKKM